ncbi:protein SMAX1-LIKE 7 [Senna tora]|uniref:Protein SMAX1-LIKE 7 n=1 Tax=Senna tora TaxID=362788 RepID=A0A834WWS4_9FABA|nr:protein SMAX1-LIKE 7 [Senna tora]
MAAIKRSQANQRRHPESFHLFQMHNQQNHQTASLLKVELKHFVLSILDDPIVSRVFGEVGFRSCDVKLALLQPPVVQQPSRFSRSRLQPVFLCNLTGSDTGRPGSNFNFKYPFLGNSGFMDENCRRIGEVLVRKTKRNPILIGVYARNAIRNFMESVLQKGDQEGVMPAGIAGLTVTSIEKEISEVLGEEGGSEEKMGLKLKELSRSFEQCSGPGIAVNFGELEGFVREGVPCRAASFVVSQLTRLLEVHGEKIWVMGVAGTSETYAKFLALFPNVEKDWDLHLLTMTSTTPSMEGLYSKSGLMGSFVPLGGFFSSPSEFKNPLSCINPSFTRCHSCNQKYEQEVADILKVGPTTSISGYSTILPRSEKSSVNTDQGLDVAKTAEDKASLNAKILGLQKKWGDFCERLHHNQSVPDFDASQTRSQVPILGGFQFHSSLKESSSKQISPVPVSSDIASVNTGSDQVAKVSSMFESRSSSSPLTPVTTDLGLGTIYRSATREPNTWKPESHKEHLQVSNDNNLHQVAGSSSCSGPSLDGKFNSVDFKSLNQLLAEQIGWQDEAICAIVRTLSLRRSGRGKHCGSHVRGDVWFAFFGPDRFGKKKIASVLTKIIFGNTESLIFVDLNSPDRAAYPLNSIFESDNSCCYDMLKRKTVVDYIAGELKEVEDDIDDKSNESLGELHSEAWLNDFCDQMDEKVVFKPLNFDALAEKILKSISTQFRRTFGSEFLLEIDYEVMIQILANTWLADKKNAVEDWIEHVLGKSFNEAKQKYQLSKVELVMKLVSCEGIFVEEHAPGVCLPARINLN